MSLKKYQAKRDLKVSKEPKAKVHKRSKNLHFVVQKHAASRLHYDFRLEVDGVLKSWAIPKGPSLNPQDKRLAIMVEDHPYDYKDFEGVIPEGYGAGRVQIWDQGIYTASEQEMREGLKRGEISFALHGEKLEGEFALVRMKENEWLLIKKKDAFVSKEDVLKQDRSVVSNATIDEIGKGPKKKMPHHIDPMLATLIDAPFDDPEWLFEIKWDGFRAVAEVKKGRVELYSRNHQSFNTKFSPIVGELKKLKVEAIFDGEVVALDKKGYPQFQLLQNEAPEHLCYTIFDLLYLNGRDLRGLPLLERKALLKEVLPAENDLLRYNDHIEEKGISFFKQASKEGLEGIIGKRKDSLYQDKRSKEWVKIKRHIRQEVVVCGFTEPRSGRKDLGALIMGVYKKGKLTFAGHVGGGFTFKKLKEVRALLTSFIQSKCPFQKVPKTNTPVTWVKPHFRAEVSFSEWTSEGIMRQPIFLEMREDKLPRSVKKEEPISKEEVLKPPLTHLAKIYFPKDKFTKGDVIHYYETMAPIILPYLKDRPQSLKRFPDGITGQSFFQKNLLRHPEWIQTAKVAHKEKDVNYLLIQDLQSLLYAVNLGCIEMHPFFSRIQSLDSPDFLVLDLDPEGVSFDKVIETAQVIHALLNHYKIPNYCKTSGASGMHICVPLGAKYSFEESKAFAELLAKMVHEEIPSFTSLERLPKNRKRKVYIDYLQNNPGQTIASVYSLRARPKAPVSTPLDWSEVKKGLRPERFTIENLFKRVQEMGDLFLPILGKGVVIEKVLKQIERER